MAVTKYLSYRPLTTQLAARVLKTKPTKADRERTGLTGAMRAFMPFFPHAFRIMDGSILMEEWHWLHHGRPMIFPETVATLESINRGKFRVEAADGLRAPYPSFVVNMPRGFNLCGQQCPAVLVTSITLQERINNFYAPFLRDMRMTHLDPNNVESPMQLSERALCLTYKISENKVGDVFGRCTLSWNMMARALSCKDAREFAAVIGEYPEIGKYSAVDSLTAEENEFQFQLLQFVVKMLIYMQATDALRPGFPASTRDESTPMYFHAKEAPQASVFRLAHESRESSPKSAHYRSFTIRQLRDERYYKGEYAQMERGSRFVFVKDTFVGADVDANTLIEA